MPMVECWSPPQPMASPLARSVKSVAPKPCAAQWRVQRPIRSCSCSSVRGPPMAWLHALVVPDAVHEPQVVLDQLPAGQAGGLDQLTGTPWARIAVRTASAVATIPARFGWTGAASAAGTTGSTQRTVGG